MVMVWMVVVLLLLWRVLPLVAIRCRLLVWLVGGWVLLVARHLEEVEVKNKSNRSRKRQRQTTRARGRRSVV